MSGPPGFAPPRRPRHARRRDATAPIGGLPLPPVEIPYAWVGTPLIRRPTTPIGSARVTQRGGVVATVTDAASVRRYGGRQTQVTLDTACDADPANLARHLVTYYRDPLPRQPVLAFNLIARADDEALLILGVGIGRRVRVTQPPAAWPPGAANVMVIGVQHVIQVDRRDVVWYTAPVIGTTPGTPGPWFRWGSSRWGPDLRPY